MVELIIEPEAEAELEEAANRYEERAPGLGFDFDIRQRTLWWRKHPRCEVLGLDANGERVGATQPSSWAATAPSHEYAGPGETGTEPTYVQAIR
jgi:hypothetical protein